MTETTAPTDITPRSLEIFLALADDAGNWAGTPLFDGSKEDRGNLTQLKIAGLVTSFTEGGCTFVEFTDAGAAFAAKHGIDVAVDG